MKHPPEKPWTQEQQQRLHHRIVNHGTVCVDCGESLTLSERALGDCYCIACWPLVERKEEADATAD